MKTKIKEILIASLVGATITFLSKFLEGLVGLNTGDTNNIIGGVATFGVYVKMAFRHIV